VINSTHSGIKARRLIVASLILVLAGFLLTGCSTYSERNAQLRDDVARRDYESALTVIEKAERGSDRLLNLLEQGLVLHYADRWLESNAVFQEAEELSDDLYTKSVSQAVVSLVTNDGAIDYRAAPFEMALVPYFRSLNYIALGEKDEALVEARKAELRLRDLAVIEQNQGEDGDGPAVSLEDHAFIHYLRGMLHEWGGETNDAFLAYRRAAMSYQATGGKLKLTTPPWLGQDLTRTATWLGFEAELDEIAVVSPELLEGDQSSPDGVGRVVLFLETGWAPHRVSAEADIPIFSDDDRGDVDLWSVGLRHRYRYGWNRNVEVDYWLRFAMPELIVEEPVVVGARLSTGTLGGLARTTRIESVAARSQLFYDRAAGKILLKTIGRALTKYMAQEAIEDKNEVAGLLANLFGAATERADTRNWLTLPSGISMARLVLPPGIYDLEVELVDARDRVVDVRMIEGVEVRADDWVFLSRRVF
jgi:hypothetical protein